MVGKDEGKQIASSANVVSQDWHAGWDTDDEDSAPIGSSRASVDEAQEAREISLAPLVAHEDDDDAADAWGWGDEDVVNEATPENNSEPPPRTTIPNSRAIPETREITLSETYYTSSIPQPVFNTVAGLFNDGAKLASAEYVLIISAPPLYLTALTDLRILSLLQQYRVSSLSLDSFSRCIDQFLRIITPGMQVETCKY